jgi:hypothetical protein
VVIKGKQLSKTELKKRIEEIVSHNKTLNRLRQGLDINRRIVILAKE